MAQPLFDQILKAMAERRPKPFVFMAFQKKNFRVISSKYDTELIIRTRRVDKVIHIEDEDGEHLINYEFQSRYRRPIGKRLFVYAGALTATHNLEVSREVFKQEEQTMDIIWEDVPFIGERISEVKAEGKAEALQKVILEVLSTRFDVANGKIARMVNSIDKPQKLEVIFRRALKAKSLDTVVNMLQKAKPPAKRKAAK